jgi:hypothetical protein
MYRIVSSDLLYKNWFPENMRFSAFHDGQALSLLFQDIFIYFCISPNDAEYHLINLIEILIFIIFIDHQYVRAVILILLVP